MRTDLTDADVAAWLLTRFATETEKVPVVVKVVGWLSPCRHSIDFASVRWYGTDYVFTGTQSAAVKLLWAAWEGGTPEVRHDTILAEINSDSDRLAKVFQGHPAWGAMIVAGDAKGTFRLRQQTGGYAAGTRQGEE